VSAAPRPDVRVLLAVALAALGVALAAPHPASALLVAAAAAAALRVDGRLRARALLAPLLVGLPAAALAAWLGAGGAAAPASAALSAGAARGLLLLARVLAASLVLAWLTARLAVAELAGALAALGLPAPLLDLLVLADGQRHVLRRAYEGSRDALSLRVGGEGLRRAAAATGLLAGAVACRAIDRSGALADAIALRGGVAWRRSPSFRPGRRDLAHLGGAAALLGLAAACSWGRPW
jgi:energy-coupling factor transporter transmembrane protein EcfT